MPSSNIGVKKWNSRIQRRQIRLQKAASVSEQLKITDFYAIVQNISDIAETDFDLKESLRMMTENYLQLKENNSEQDKKILSSGTILTRMINECLRQESASSTGQRYKDKVLLKFGMNIWILGGRKLYEIIHSNFRGIFPCPRTIQVKLLEYDTFHFDPSIAFADDRNPTANSHSKDKSADYEDESDGCLELPSDEEECPDRHDFDVLKSIHGVDFKDYSSRLINAKNEKKSYQFLRIPDLSGKMRLVKKSTVVWFCETSFKRLSNDRTFRVRGPTPHSPNRDLVVDTVESKEKLDVGNWAIFRTTPGSSISGIRLTENYLLGRVIGFAELDSSKKSNSEILQWKKSSSEKIGVLCHWYRLNREKQSFTGAITKLAVDSHGFHDCDTYVCSVLSPAFDGLHSVFNIDIAHKIDLFLKNSTSHLHHQNKVA